MVLVLLRNGTAVKRYFLDTANQYSNKPCIHSGKIRTKCGQLRSRKPTLDQWTATPSDVAHSAAA